MPRRKVTDTKSALLDMAVRLGGDAVRARELAKAQDAELEDLRERMKLSAAHLARITTLLRSSIPESDQIGVGADGMAQSLLARLARLSEENHNLRVDNALLRDRLETKA